MNVNLKISSNFILIVLVVVTAILRKYEKYTNYKVPRLRQHKLCLSLRKMMKRKKMMYFIFKRKIMYFFCYMTKVLWYIKFRFWVYHRFRNQQLNICFIKLCFIIISTNCMHLYFTYFFILAGYIIQLTIYRSSIDLPCAVC